MEDITFKTTNEAKVYNKPKIPAGEYGFEISDVKVNNENRKIFFILDIEGQKTEDGEQVSLVWAAPINSEYTALTNVGKILLAVGLELGSEIKANTLIGLKGKAIVNDYAKQESGKTLQYSVIGDLIIPEQKEEVKDNTTTQ